MPRRKEKGRSAPVADSMRFDRPPDILLSTLGARRAASTERRDQRRRDRQQRRAA